MKKRTIIFIVIGVISIVALSFVSWRLITIPSFADVTWTREADDTEYIHFGSDGEFSYWCSCGNPVASSDMIEYYKYNALTKKIKLVWYDQDNKKNYDIYEVIKVDDNQLILKIGNSSREFTLYKNI